MQIKSVLASKSWTTFFFFLLLVMRFAGRRIHWDALIQQQRVCCVHEPVDDGRRPLVPRWATFFFIISKRLFLRQKKREDKMRNTPRSRINIIPLRQNFQKSSFHLKIECNSP